MKFFSMFSGLGGFELGIYQVYPDAECVGYAEIDKHASAVYRYHWPNHKNYGNVSNIIPGNLPDFDLLVGGFPCQDLSIAGKGLGFNGKRSALFFEIVRICEVKRPAYICLENVAGLLSSKHRRDLVTIYRELAGLGYEVEHALLNSKFFGVPQNRERVFFIGNLGGQPRPEILSIGEAADVYTGEHEQGDIANCLDTSYHKGWLDHGQRTHVMGTRGATSLQGNDYANTVRTSGLRPHSTRHNWDFVVENKKEVAVDNRHGVPKNNDDYASCLTAGGNSGGNHSDMDVIIVASRGRNPADPSDRTTGAPTEQRLEPNKEGISNTLTSVAKDNLVVHNLQPRQGKGKGGKGRLAWRDGVTYSLDTGNGQAVEIQPLTAAGTSQGERVYSSEGVSPSLGVGNGACKPQVEVKQINPSKESGGQQPYQRNRVYDANGLAPALNASLGDHKIGELRYDEGLRTFGDNISGALRTTSDCGDKVVFNQTSIRRLTPTECCRLQA